MILQILLSGLINALAYSLIALGFSFIYRTTKIFHFAHAGIYALSAYVFYTFYTVLEIPIALAFLAALLVSAVVGVLTDVVIYRPLVNQGASLLILLLGSLMFNSVIINLIAMFYGNETKVIAAGLQPTHSFSGVVVSRIQFIIAIFSIFFLCLNALVVFRTSVGRMIRAASDDSELLSSIGINMGFVRVGVFAAGSCLCAIPAILVGFDVGITPYVGMKAMLKAAVAVIIGGPRLFEGPLIGALTIGILESLSVLLISSQWSDIITFSLLFIFLMLSPEGVYPLTRRVEN
jgi:branched-chain amino acid transport system permease protein